MVNSSAVKEKLLVWQRRIGRKHILKCLGGIVAGCLGGRFFAYPVMLLYIIVVKDFTFKDITAWFVLFYALYLALMWLIMRFAKSMVDDSIDYLFHPDLIKDNGDWAWIGTKIKIYRELTSLIVMFILWPRMLYLAVEEINLYWQDRKIKIDCFDDFVSYLLYPRRRITLKELDMLDQQTFNNAIMPLIELKICDYYADYPPSVCITPEFRDFLGRQSRLAEERNFMEERAE